MVAWSLPFSPRARCRSRAVFVWWFVVVVPGPAGSSRPRLVACFLRPTEPCSARAQETHAHAPPTLQNGKTRTLQSCHSIVTLLARARMCAPPVVRVAVDRLIVGRGRGVPSTWPEARGPWSREERALRTHHRRTLAHGPGQQERSVPRTGERPFRCGRRPAGRSWEHCEHSCPSGCCNCVRSYSSRSTFLTIADPEPGHDDPGP